MTSPISARRASNVLRGFTLIELLVVIGIIVLIAGIALPVLSRARNAAARTQAAATLSTISIALEAYQQDHRSYPMLSHPLSGPDVANGGGAWLLCQVLIAPAPASIDHVDGPGFALRANSKKFGPYLQPDKFIVDDDDDSTNTVQLHLAILRDQNYQPIAYIPARSPRPNVTVNDGYLMQATAAADSPMFDANYVIEYFKHDTGDNDTLAIQRLAAMIGADGNGALDVAGGKKVLDANYLLWISGRDQLFGPTDPTDAGQVRRCDDVTNFTHTP